MSWIVRQYPGEDALEANPDVQPIELTQHGSFGEAQIDVFERAARWHQDQGGSVKVTAPEDPDGTCRTAICWKDGKIAYVLVAERIT
jgi:hypothetical protein